MTPAENLAADLAADPEYLARLDQDDLSEDPAFNTWLDEQAPSA